MYKLAKKWLEKVEKQQDKETLCFKKKMKTLIKI